MSLERFCQKPVVTIGPHETVVEACRLLHEHNIGCLMVETSGALSGVVTDRDIALKVAGQKRDPAQTTVGEIMTVRPTSIEIDKTVHDLTAVMHSRHIRRVPIVDDGGKVRGIVTLDDLLILLSEELADLGSGISGALFRKPHIEAETEASPPFGWLMSYL